VKVFLTLKKCKSIKKIKYLTIKAEKMYLKNYMDIAAKK